MKSKKEESYQLTFLGLLSIDRGLPEAQSIIDTIELYMRRCDYNAIVFSGNKFEFAKVEKQ